MKKYSYLLITGAVLVISFVVSNSALAASIDDDNESFTTRKVMVYAGKGPLQKPVATGKVALINDNTITITDSNGDAHLLDISQAKISTSFGVKAPSLALTDIKTGDKILAFGTSSGLSVIAAAK
jgi:hypothetical protein